MVPSGVIRTEALIAVIDEDAAARRSLTTALTSAHYRFASYADYESAARTPNFPDSFQALVLDLAAPELGRLEVIAAVRARSEVPLIVVTALGAEADKIAALDAGADDYLVKPLLEGEFLARMRVALRHGRARRGPAGGRVEVAGLVIDLLGREVTLHGVRLDLTPTDYKLLALLARNRGRVVPQQQMLHEAWGPHARDPHYLRVYMARLRRKLDPARVGTQYISTEPGIGYRLNDDAK